MTHRLSTILAACAFAGLGVGTARVAGAQVTPAAGATPQGDTPKISVGVTLFADYSYQDTPAREDDDGNTIHFSSFNIGRAYINVTGSLSHLFAFRVTPDITRASSASGSTNTLPTGSYTLRLKLAYGQVNLDDWTTPGTWVRLGMHDTPFVPYTEGIYRYRFQGPIFEDREGFLSSADVGVSGRFAFPGNYGDIHAGVYNGEGFASSEVNDQKAFQVRGTLRPAPMVPVLTGLRLAGFYDADHYVANAKRQRAIGQLTFEHPYVNGGFDWLDARDQTSVTEPELRRDGFSVWVTPRTPFGLEALFRYDLLRMNKDVAPKPQKERLIAGLAYWPAIRGGMSVAFLADYTEEKQKNVVPVPAKTRIYSLHTLFNF
ncbi:MAG: hypothetical protein ACRD00_05810 [Thermoanaerobaculia bacterium]